MLFQRSTIVIISICMVMAIRIGATPVPADHKIEWVILKESMVKVNGSTNVSKFACSIPNYSNSDTVTCIVKSGSNKGVMMSGHAALPVFGFDCMNIMMTKDLRKTLRSKEFPLFYIHFLSLEKYPGSKNKQESISGSVIIELAGVKKTMVVNYKISTDDQKVIHLSGTQSILFSDYKLVPPRKLGGMIQTNDRLDVEFVINFRVIKSII